MATSVCLINERKTPRLARHDEMRQLQKTSDRINLAAIYGAQRMLERLTDAFQEHCHGTLECPCNCVLCRVLHPASDPD